MGVRESLSSPFNLPSRGPGALNPEIEQATGQRLSPLDRSREEWPEVTETVEEKLTRRGDDAALCQAVGARV